MVKFYSGDLFATPKLKAFAHGCNCAGAMGKGIALQFKDRYPNMYMHYYSMCMGRQFVLGSVYKHMDLAKSEVVFNIGTQEDWTTPAEFEAIRCGLYLTLSMAKASGITDIGLPRIGCGLGGLPWVQVGMLINELGSKKATNLHVCETYVPGQPMF